MSGQENTPNSYRQWMECFEYLSCKTVTEEYIESLKVGTCPGIDHVINPFLERLGDTVNNMLNRCTKNCTKLLNEYLEDGDFSNLEVVLRRADKDLEKCRFYLNISFIPKTYVDELDKNTASEIKRYWKTMKEFFEEISEEAGSSELYDMVYYMNRLVAKDK